MAYIGSTPIILTGNLNQLLDVESGAPGNNNILVYSTGSGEWQYQNLETDNVLEGNTNLYYTDARVSSFLNGNLNTSIIPSANVTYDLGSTTNRFRDLYLSGTSIELGDASITASGNAIVLPAGSTISGAGTLLDSNTSTTDDLSEGVTNLYYTTLRANTDIDARVTKTFVDNLGVDAATLEGANGSYYLDWTNTTNKPDPNVEVVLSGDVTGSANATLTDLGNGTISITTTIAENSVALGTDTTGDYVSTISGGTGVTVTGGTGETSTPSIAIGQDVGTSANVTFQNGTFTGDLQIDGDFTVGGNVVSINVQELSVEDNIIYLNANAATANPDLGWVGGYNDGTYAHAGIFRDATDGVFKAFDGYTPEPDASPYIDTTHGSFSLADIQGAVLKGNSFEVNGYGAVITANGEWIGDPDTVRGYTGSRGFTGSQGIQGIQGYTGSQGIIGYTGSRGFTGSQGIQGIQGYTGSQGIQGVIGYTGSQGIQGIQGYTGSQGIQGIQGYTGSQGIQGVRGYTGSQGIQGVIGYTGSQGIQGIQGYTGSRGFTGSQGPIGYTGSQGIQGPIGYTGSQGIQGVRGYTGSQGIQGIQGYTGSQGIQGVIGYTGSRGVIGYTGSRGFTGSRGVIGYTGSRGFTGSLGNIGYTGSRGFTGSQGPSTAINATNDTATSTLYPVLVGASGSDQTPKVTTTKLYFDASTGTLSATEINSLSDETLKENMNPIQNALDIIQNLQGIQFNWKDNHKTSYGLSAQRVEEIIPELVSTNDYKSVNYSGIIAFLIEAIKALNDKIENK